MPARPRALGRRRARTAHRPPPPTRGRAAPRGRRCGSRRSLPASTGRCWRSGCARRARGLRAPEELLPALLDARAAPPATPRSRWRASAAAGSPARRALGVGGGDRGGVGDRHGRGPPRLAAGRARPRPRRRPRRRSRRPGRRRTRAPGPAYWPSSPRASRGRRALPRARPRRPPPGSARRRRRPARPAPGLRTRPRMAERARPLLQDIGRAIRRSCRRRSTRPPRATWSTPAAPRHRRARVVAAAAPGGAPLTLWERRPRPHSPPRGARRPRGPSTPAGPTPPCASGTPRGRPRCCPSPGSPSWPACCRSPTPSGRAAHLDEAGARARRVLPRPYGPALSRALVQHVPAHPRARARARSDRPGPPARRRAARPSSACWHSATTCTGSSRMTDVLRAHAEQQFADELAALDARRRPAAAAELAALAVGGRHLPARRRRPTAPRSRRSTSATAG